jgi:DNA-binding NtrC family response regulator
VGLNIHCGKETKMATIRVAQGKDWTNDLAQMLTCAGHEVIGDGVAELGFSEAANTPHFDGAATIIVTPLDEVTGAIAKVKRGDAYAFVRYPFVDDEVAILVNRTLDHVRLARENDQLRQRQGEAAPAAPVAPAALSNGDADPVAVARNLAGKPLADIEKQVILSTLEQFKGHRVRTATALGIGVRTLGMKLKRWREEGEPIVGRSVHRPVEHAGM